VTNQAANKIKRQESSRQLQIIEQTNMRQQTPSRRANNASENHRAKQYNRANKQTKSIGDGNSPSQRDCWISNLA
jgi:hypothetical protein